MLQRKASCFVKVHTGPSIVVQRCSEAVDRRCGLRGNRVAGGEEDRGFVAGARAMVAGHAGRAGLLEREPQDRTESETEERDECERKVREEREREVREVQERKAAKDDRQKQQRREKQARRLKEAEETCNGSGDLPLARTRAELARILGNNHPILYIGQIFDTLEVWCVVHAILCAVLVLCVCVCARAHARPCLFVCVSAQNDILRAVLVLLMCVCECVCVQM